MVRPALPPGPWLVVGLARSGVAAARVLHDRGETVVGTDRGHPATDLPEDVPVHPDTDGLTLLPQPALSSRARCPGRRP